MTQSKKTNVVLVLYYHTLEANAPTIMEYVEAFKNYSKFEILNLNIAKGFPRGLSSIEFSAIILHYSLFSWFPARLNKSFIN